jgi:hypothetical protein
MGKEYAHSGTNSGVVHTTTVRSADVSCASRHFLCEESNFMVVFVVSHHNHAHIF